MKKLCYSISYKDMSMKLTLQALISRLYKLTTLKCVFIFSWPTQKRFRVCLPRYLIDLSFSCFGFAHSPSPMSAPASAVVHSAAAALVAPASVGAAAAPSAAPAAAHSTHESNSSAAAAASASASAAAAAAAPPAAAAPAAAAAAAPPASSSSSSSSSSFRPNYLNILGATVLDDNVRLLSDFLYQFAQQADVEIEGKLGLVFNKKKERRVYIDGVKSIVYLATDELDAGFSAEVDAVRREAKIRPDQTRPAPPFHSDDQQRRRLRTPPSALLHPWLACARIRVAADCWSPRPVLTPFFPFAPLAALSEYVSSSE